MQKQPINQIPLSLCSLAQFLSRFLNELTSITHAEDNVCVYMCVLLCLLVAEYG